MCLRPEFGHILTHFEFLGDNFWHQFGDHFVPRSLLATQFVEGKLKLVELLPLSLGGLWDASYSQ